MLCAACELLLKGTPTDEVSPRLMITCGPQRLRPMLRRPITVTRYHCQACQTNWLREVDMLTTTPETWICLYTASNILMVPEFSRI